jgi:Protein of unknown function (DUF4058)
MASPFPGMDPYLEDTEIWPGFHAKLAVEIQRRLNGSIGPRYYADVEVQSTMQGVEIETDSGPTIRPDVSVFEPLDTPSRAAQTQSNSVIADMPTLIRPISSSVRQYRVRVFLTRTSEVVAIIEILSPVNKRPNTTGLTQYRIKRDQILASRVHLIELDLLRIGERPGLEVQEEPIDADYVVVVNRADVSRLSSIWLIAIGERLPNIPVPLLPPDDDFVLDLNASIQQVYADSGYAWRINYKSPMPYPPTRHAIVPIVQQLIAAHQT